MKIAITGVSGYIGQAICEYFSATHTVVGFCRSSTSTDPAIRSLGDYHELRPQELEGVEVLIHAAGVSDVRAEAATLRSGNIDVSRHIAEVCRQSGVQKMINLSSVKAAGEGNVGPTHPTYPEGEYGRSKLRAEEEMTEAVRGSLIQLTHVRFPMVYSISAKNSFAGLMRLARLSAPIPYKALSGSRSYCGLNHLIAFLEAVLGSQNQSGTFYVADRAPIRLDDLLEVLAECQGNLMRNLPVPGAVIAAVLKVLSPRLATQLFHDAEVDIEATRRMFPEWHPETTQANLRQMFALRHEIGRDGRI